MFTASLRALYALFPILLIPLPAAAQSDAGGAPATQAEISVLRQEIRDLRAQLERLSRGAAPSPAGPSLPGGQPPAAHAPQARTAPQPALADAVAMLQTQVAEQAQTKVESSSRLPVKLTGMILLNAAFNSGDANWLEHPNLTAANASPTGSHSATLRQSRIGLSVDGPTLGSLRTSSLLAFDFFGGTPAFATGSLMGLPRLLYGFVRLEGDRTSIEVGQDEAILAPRDPTSLASQSFPLLFRSGNLYLRAPQARVERRLGARTTLTAGVVSPVAGDYDGPYTFAPPALSGERARTPAIQAHVGYASSAEAPRRVAIGLSGHAGRLRRATGERDESWAAALDFDVRAGRFGVAGELFAGRNLAAYGGGSGHQGRAHGGFVEARVQAATRVDLVGGFGLDRRDSLPDGTTPRREQRTAFGSVTVRLTPELATSLEYRHLSAEFVPSGDRRGNHHLNLAFAFTF